MGEGPAMNECGGHARYNRPRPKGWHVESLPHPQGWLFAPKGSPPCCAGPAHLGMRTSRSAEPAVRMGKAAGAILPLRLAKPHLGCSPGHPLLHERLRKCSRPGGPSSEIPDAAPNPRTRFHDEPEQKPKCGPMSFFQQNVSVSFQQIIFQKLASLQPKIHPKTCVTGRFSQLLKGTSSFGLDRPPGKRPSKEAFRRPCKRAIGSVDGGLMGGPICISCNGAWRFGSKKPMSPKGNMTVMTYGPTFPFGGSMILLILVVVQLQARLLGFRVIGFWRNCSSQSKRKWQQSMQKLGTAVEKVG